MKQTFTGRVDQVAGRDIVNLGAPPARATRETLQLRRDALYARYLQVKRKHWLNPHLAVGVVVLGLTCAAVWAYGFAWLDYPALMLVAAAVAVPSLSLQIYRRKLAAEQADLVRLIREIDAAIILSA